MSTNIRVLLVDDFVAFRRLILWIFTGWAQLKVVAEAADGAEAIARTEELRPDLVILDIGLPDLNGVEVARRIRTIAKNSRIVFLSENQFVEVAREALKIGNAFVLKSDATADLLKAIAAVMQGEKFVSRTLARFKLI